MILPVAACSGTIRAGTSGSIAVSTGHPKWPNAEGVVKRREWDSMPAMNVLVSGSRTVIR